MEKFWDEIRRQVKESGTAGDVTVNVYRKLATGGANQLAVIKPAYFLGQLTGQTRDFIGLVEKFLALKEGELDTHLRLVLYMRESARGIYHSVRDIASPLEDLIIEFEELFEGEEDDLDLEEAEPEEMDEPAPLPEEVEGEEETGSADLDDTREAFMGKCEELGEALRVKLRDTGAAPRVCEELASRISLVYLECVQFSWDLERLISGPEGDVANLLSVLIDLQFGLDLQLRQLIWEDILLDGETPFKLGLLTWISHFVSDLLERIEVEGTEPVV